jgi:hypothetical protein
MIAPIQGATSDGCRSVGSRHPEAAEQARYLDGAAFTPVDAVEHAVQIVARESVDVVVLHHEVAALREHGSIAALLRW